MDELNKENDKPADDQEIMRRIIEEKKQKSSNQGSVKKGPKDWNGTTKAGNKREKKGGLSPK